MIELSQNIIYGNCVEDLIVVLRLQDEFTLHYQEQHSNGQMTGSGILTKISTRSIVDSPKLSSCISPPEGLISWWPGDGNADDIVGKNSGKLIGGVGFTDGVVSQAFRFDGSNDIVMATATGFPTGAAPRTVAFWAKTDPSANNATGFGYGNETAGGGFYIFPAHGENSRRLTFSGHGTSVNVFASNDLRDGQYHYVVATYDGSKLTLYVDGTSVAAGNPGLNTGTSGGACIGGRCYQGEFFAGEVDEIAVWDRNLSRAEIEALFHAGNADMCKSENAGRNSGSKVTYEAHIAGIGWMDSVSDGEIAGTTGQSRRMEAIRIRWVDAPLGAHISYQAHVEGIGWMNWVLDGVEAGTTGQSRRMEAIRIRLDNAPPGYSVTYQAHVEGIGWMNWISNGETAGTTNQSRRMEAIRIRIIEP